MGKTLRRIAGKYRSGWRTTALAVAVLFSALWTSVAPAQNSRITTPVISGENVRLDSGRFTVVASARDHRFARSMLNDALRQDSFPGLPRPRARVLIAIAPNAAVFRAWVGPYAPEWGAAVAFPDEQRIVMQGSFGASDAGNPETVLRHELAHLALHEHMGDLPSRWFDEGYASLSAGEWSRTDALQTSLTMVWRSLPGGDELNDEFTGGSSRAQYAYALSHLAVAEMQAIDQKRGLANFFQYWKQTGKYEQAVRLAYGMSATSFDDYWHKRVNRQYGALALVTNLSLAFGFIALLLGPVYWQKRRRNEKRLEAMRAAEAVQDAAARRSALEALLALEVAVAPEAQDTSDEERGPTFSGSSLDSGTGQV